MRKIVGLFAVAALLSGCVYSQKAHDIQIRLEERAKADLKTAGAEIQALGKAQTTLDNERTSAKIQKAYETDFRNNFTRGDLNAMFATVDVRDAKKAQLRTRLLSKAGKYDKIAAKLDRVGQAVEGIGQIDTAQNSATTELWNEFLREDLPGIAAKGIADISAAAAAKKAASTSDGVDPTAEANDPTAEGNDSGDPTDTTGGK